MGQCCVLTLRSHIRNIFRLALSVLDKTLNSESPQSWGAFLCQHVIIYPNFSPSWSDILKSYCHPLPLCATRVYLAMSYNWLLCNMAIKDVCYFLLEQALYFPVKTMLWSSYNYCSGGNEVPTWVALRKDKQHEARCLPWIFSGCPSSSNKET